MIRARARIALILVLAVPAASARAQEKTVVDPNFVIDRLYVGTGMISIDFGPGGRLYVAEKVGRILTLAPDGKGGYATPSVVADLRTKIDHEQESGLLGLIVDPSFATNRTMYLFYTTRTDQKLVRIQLDPTFRVVVPGSERVLLEGLPRKAPLHNAGDLQFAPEEPDALYVSLGDDGSPTPVSSDPARYEGKILRVSKVDGLGLADNPFFDGNPRSVRSRVWAVGFRNPFRFVFHPARPQDDVLYTSENGADVDRFSWVRRGSNGGWSPLDGREFSAPSDRNHRVLGVTKPFLTGIAIATSGPFAEDGSVLYLANPQEFAGRGSIRRYRLTGPELDAVQPLAEDQGQPFAIGVPCFDMAFGPDGALYCTQTSAGESPETWYALHRIRHVSGAPPVAKLAAQPAKGEAPLVVSFKDLSTDADGAIRSWSWDFGDGGRSSERNTAHVYRRPGVFTATLTVRDMSGLLGTAKAEIRAVRAAALTIRGDIGPLETPAVLAFHQGEDRAPLGFPGGTGPSKNNVRVPAGGEYSVTISTELISDEITVTAADEAGVLQPATRGFRLGAGRSHTEELDFQLSAAAVRGRVLDTRANPARVELEASIGDAGVHTTRSDVLGWYYLPLPSGVSGTLHVAIDDAGGNVHLPTSYEVELDDVLIERDLVVGLQALGTHCDPVPAESTEPIDYASQIQPIWNTACVGCHVAGESTSGGLDLSGDAYDRLVSVMSREVPGRELVEPGDPARSYLYEKLSCNRPQVGTRMRPGNPLAAEQRALIFNWIQQGAQRVPPPAETADGCRCTAAH